MSIKLNLLCLAILSVSFSFGQIKLADLQVDTTITGFHFAADFQGTVVFTKHGQPDLNTLNPSAFSFTIAQGMTAKEAVGQLAWLINTSKEHGYAVSDVVKKDTTLNGHAAYYTSYTETDVKTAYKNLVFNAFVIKDKTLILFVSGDLDNGRYAKKFQQTFYSIRL